MIISLQDIEYPYVTTDYLLNLYRDYRSPRNKINSLVADKKLIHVRQGLYLLGEDFNKGYSKEVLSGMIYGPSAISFEYALSLHGLIPERVETVTCICFKRNKTFTTPVGTFTYRYISKKLYPIGLVFRETPLGNYFVASKEKALCDMAYGHKFTDEQDAYEYVTESLRIEKEELDKLSPSLLMEIAKAYKRKSVAHLVDGIIIRQRSILNPERL